MQLRPMNYHTLRDKNQCLIRTKKNYSYPKWPNAILKFIIWTYLSISGLFESSIFIKKSGHSTKKNVCSYFEWFNGRNEHFMLALNKAQNCRPNNSHFLSINMALLCVIFNGVQYQNAKNHIVLATVSKYRQNDAKYHIVPTQLPIELVSVKWLWCECVCVHTFSTHFFSISINVCSQQWPIK